MAATTVHGDAIMAALKSTVGNVGGMAAKWEAYPLPWPKDAQLPIGIFHMADFLQEIAGKHFNQRYTCEIYYVIQMDINTSEPEKYCRQQAELIVDQIMGNRNLGLDNNYSATVVGYTPENELTLFFRNENQRRTSYLITVEIDVYEVD